MLHEALCIISKPWVNSNSSYSPETLNSGQNRQFFVQCHLQIWGMTLKNNRVPLLCCFKLCASFHSHQWIQTRVTVRKRAIWVKINFFVPCDFEIWQMTLKNNRAPLLCYFKLCASFVAIGEFKLELQSGDAQFGSKSTIFLAVWPWNFTDNLEKQ